MKQLLPIPFDLQENPDSRQLLSVWLHKGTCLVSCYSFQMDDPSKSWGFTLTAIAQAVAASEAVEMKAEKDVILANIIREFIVYMQDKLKISAMQHPTHEDVENAL